MASLNSSPASSISLEMLIPTAECSTRLFSMRISVAGPCTSMRALFLRVLRRMTTKRASGPVYSPWEEEITARWESAHGVASVISLSRYWMYQLGWTPPVVVERPVAEALRRGCCGSPRSHAFIEMPKS